MGSDNVTAIRPTTSSERARRLVRSILLVTALMAAAACNGDTTDDEANRVDDGADAELGSDRSRTTTTTEGPTTTEAAPDPTDTEGMWISPAELGRLPTSGPAWAAVLDAAESDWDEPDLGNQNDTTDTDVLAGALVAVRRVDPEMRAKVVDALEEVTGSYPGRVLPVARNLVSYVVAADLVDLEDPAFDAWLVELLDHDSDSRAGIESLRESALRDPSNHGTHARSSVLAVALRVGDDALVDEIAGRFEDWLGRSSLGFEWRELDWQADPDSPVGINPPGAQIDGLDVDGVLPEEQRRSGGFTTEPEQESYVWEALQGAIVTAEMLERAGYPAWSWQDAALRRAFVWLHEVNDYPAEGDDTWQPWLVNARTELDLPAPSPTEPGKNMGFTDWTHGPRR